MRGAMSSPSTTAMRRRRPRARAAAARASAQAWGLTPPALVTIRIPLARISSSRGSIWATKSRA